MAPPPDSLRRLNPFAVVMDQIRREEAERGIRAVREITERVQRDVAERTEALDRAAEAILTHVQADTLSGRITMDPSALPAILRDETVAIEFRGKLMEVLIYRAANNDHAYSQLNNRNAMGDVFAREGAIGDFEGMADRFAQQRKYQEAVNEAVFACPDVFVQVSESRDHMPQGRHPATEIMNTLLRKDGLYGDHTSLQEFERKMLALPPDVRGRMAYHLLDAGNTSDIHLSGERRSTGWSIEASAGNAAASLGLGFGKQWETLPDHYWQRTLDDLRADMAADLKSRDQEYKNAQAEGFVAAASHAGKMPGEAP